MSNQLPFRLKREPSRFTIGTFQLPSELRKIDEPDRLYLYFTRAEAIAEQFRILYLKYISPARRRDFCFYLGPKRFALRSAGANRIPEYARLMPWRKIDPNFFVSDRRYADIRDNVQILPNFNRKSKPST
ncbi:MAG: hypothetical protein HYZ69_01145 [Candidatus Colwellbacteria bacterium]|nr:hypothetical protein [Candidatus Colwellbacteria bacterium]